jgi:hypothetical protein
MPDIPPEPAEDKCPNCENVILTNNNWCSKCGYNKHNIEFGGNNRGYYRFSWLSFLFLFGVIPLASCGGCLVSKMSDTMAYIGFYVFVLSIITGVILIIWNLIEGRD